MDITIKLYGDLREKISPLTNKFGLPTTLNIEVNDIKRVSDILNKYNITTEEISHIFVNSKYSNTEKEIKNGDRIGLFPKRMGLIFVELLE
jgi:molybdopterin converting factor small subunit